MRLSQLLSEFLSTPSGWRATVVLVALFPRCFNFYPRPPGGGRPFCISKDICVYNFYPRPPGGGRLSHSMFPRTAETISIHALRVEGDKSIFDRLRRRIRNFYPRPPGGGRQQKRTKFSSVFAKKGEEFASLRRGKRKICRWRFKKDKFWVLIWCEGSRKSVCALASHCG